MTALQVIFILVAAATLGAALMTVIVGNMIHAALWLIVSLFGIAVVYVLLNAGFLAVAQVVIYIGAIAILVIFAIMLTRSVAVDQGTQINSNWGWGAVLALALFGALVWVLSSWPGINTGAQALPVGQDTVLQLGEALLAPNQYLLVFEVASVLLLAALIGSIMIARVRKES
ncbi:MAG TPA: NADH-quinone oxidoreductase subunit J, partial [Anaerolineales bacterium]|nr:NADH-quinone oxidoreductase subunit J [Anaerolineales bacterium]